MGNGEDALRGLLRDLGEDPGRPELVPTPQRSLAAFREIAGGIEECSPLTTTFPALGYNDWIRLDRIAFGSLCEHHMLPFAGTVSIAYWPAGDRVVGLSKLVRLVRQLSKKLQLQEHLTVRLAQTIYEKLRPRAVAVRVEAEHSCMALRGVRSPGVLTATCHRCGRAPRWPF
ncbi:MAG: GTP cyclohydrolase I [Puniceicoccales bacterium]|jgi:GTP cyclohydrolase I|nr:GTP cyclohydrolase I [Puniceicoccales bacterium]